MVFQRLQEPTPVPLTAVLILVEMPEIPVLAVTIAVTPSPTTAAVRTTQSTVTAPDSSLRKDLMENFISLFTFLQIDLHATVSGRFASVDPEERQSVHDRIRCTHLDMTRAANTMIRGSQSGLERSGY